MGFKKLTSHIVLWRSISCENNRLIKSITEHLDKHRAITKPIRLAKTAYSFVSQEFRSVKIGNFCIPVRWLAALWLGPKWMTSRDLATGLCKSKEKRQCRKARLSSVVTLEQRKSLKNFPSPLRLHRSSHPAQCKFVLYTAGRKWRVWNRRRPGGMQSTASPHGQVLLWARSVGHLMSRLVRTW